MTGPVLPAQVTITDHFDDGSGGFLEGWVEFTPSVLSKYGDGMIARVPIRRQIVGGDFSVALVAPNSPGVTPQNWTYGVRLVLGPPGSKGILGVDAFDVEEWNIRPDIAVTEVVLRDLTKVDPIAASQYTVTSVNGVSADLTGNIDLTLEADTDTDIVANVVRVGPTERAVPAGVPDSVYFMLDRNNALNDATVVFRNQDAIRGEFGVLGNSGGVRDSDLHLKVVSGTAGGETFTDALIALNPSGDIFVPGKLGIGTVPVERLHVAVNQDSGRVLAKVENTNTGAGSRSAGVQLTGGTHGWTASTDVAQNNGDNFAIQSNTIGYTPVIVATSAARVGINTDSPAAELDVIGAQRLANQASAPGTPTGGVALYADTAGALKAKNPSGAVANLDPDVSALPDTLMFGDLIGALPRQQLTSTDTLTSGFLTFSGAVCSRGAFTATKLRFIVRVVNPAGGVETFALYKGTSRTALAKQGSDIVATTSFASVGVKEITIPSLTVAKGEFVYLGMLRTGTGSPDPTMATSGTFTSTDVMGPTSTTLVGGFKSGQSALPSTLDVSASFTIAGKQVWWALAP